jgi:site-specific recombinase XerD
MGITDFQKNKKEYLQFCVNRKNLDSKTIKSYSIDLKQFEIVNNT